MEANSIDEEWTCLQIGWKGGDGAEPSASQGRARSICPRSGEARGVLSKNRMEKERMEEELGRKRDRSGMLRRGEWAGRGEEKIAGDELTTPGDVFFSLCFSFFNAHADRQSMGVPRSRHYPEGK